MNDSEAEFWTQEKTEKLKALWPSGMSHAAIGDELGCSRGAVAGKARRIKLPKRGRPVSEPKAKTKAVKLPSTTQAKQGLIKTRGSARNPGFTIQHGSKKTKGELRDMLRTAVENTK